MRTCVAQPAYLPWNKELVFRVTYLAVRMSCCALQAAGITFCVACCLGILGLVLWLILAADQIYNVFLKLPRTRPASYFP